MAGLSIATAKPKDWLIIYLDYCIELGLFVEKDGDSPGNYRIIDTPPFSTNDEALSRDGENDVAVPRRG